MENEYNKFRVYIDGWKLRENSQLKLERVGQDDRAFIPEPDTQYRLKPADDNMYQEQVFLFLCCCCCCFWLICCMKGLAVYKIESENVFNRA